MDWTRLSNSLLLIDHLKQYPVLNMSQSGIFFVQFFTPQYFFRCSTRLSGPPVWVKVEFDCVDFADARSKNKMQTPEMNSLIFKWEYFLAIECGKLNRVIFRSHSYWSLNTDKHLQTLKFRVQIAAVVQSHRLNIRLFDIFNWMIFQWIIITSAPIKILKIHCQI